MDLSDFKVHIVGLGLMGGSLALALRGKVSQITAQDMNPLESAIQSGAIDEIGTSDTADIVILATPSDQIVRLLDTMTFQVGALVMDIGSTKTTICNALDTLPNSIMAIGGHPMCGLAENGFSNAIPTLYHGARFVLCETANTTSESREIAESLVKACGAIPLWMDRHRHDYLTALTSHLPHLLSFALMRLAMDISAEDSQLFSLAAGGFDGATRLARTNEAMITGMFATNAANIRLLADRFRQYLDLLDQLCDNPDKLTQELRQIVEARRTYSSYYGERPIA